MMSWFQAFAFKWVNLYRYAAVQQSKHWTEYINPNVVQLPEPAAEAIDRGLMAVGLVTWTIVRVTPGCRIGYVDHTGNHSRVSLDWLHGPYCLSSIGRVLVVTPGGCQIGYLDHTGCQQLNRVLYPKP